MSDTVAPTETEKTEALENKSDASITPPVQPEEKKGEDQTVEQLRAELKEAQQKAMRVGQVENELAKIKEQQEKDAQKKLEEKEEFKTLYEQERAKREEFEQKQAAAAHKAEVDKAAEEVLSEYSEEVKAIAEEAGLSLVDDSEDDVKSYKERLDKIKARLDGTQHVTPNNPGVPGAKKEYTREELYEILNDPAKRDEYYRNKGGAASAMMRPQS